MIGQVLEYSIRTEEPVLSSYKETIKDLVQFLNNFAGFYDWNHFPSENALALEFLTQFPFL